MLNSLILIIVIYTSRSTRKYYQKHVLNSLILIIVVYILCKYMEHHVDMEIGFAHPRIELRNNTMGHMAVKGTVN